MRIKLTKWGNSIGFRIPKFFVMQMGMEEGKEVDVELKGGQLHISRPVESLDALLEQVTSDNCHREHDIGDPVGNEIW